MTRNCRVHCILMFIHFIKETRGSKGLWPGRSPEENVKAQSGAIYRGLLMLSTKYWQRTSRFMMLYITYESSGPLIVVSGKKIFENCILKTYCLTPSPTYETNWNNLNNFGRGPPRDNSCEVWSKSNERFQRRRCLSKKVFARHTTGDDGQRPVTIAHPEHF